MKRVLKIIGKTVLILMIVMGIIIVRMRDFGDIDYWRVLGRTYEEVIEKMGEPEYIVEGDQIDEFYYKKVIYWCDNRDELVVNVIVEDENLRFGIFQIGIGSSRDLIEMIYCFNEKYESKEEENTLEVVIWEEKFISFAFDDNDKVKKIRVSTSLIF